MAGVMDGSSSRASAILADFGSTRLDLLDDPLEFLLTEHMRQRCVCAELRRISAAGHVERAVATSIAGILLHALPMHHADEETDLFPAVLRREEPEDGLVPIIARLEKDHAGSRGAAEQIANGLMTAAAGSGQLGQDLRNSLEGYADAENHHLAIENAIVMVIARKRLKAGDLDAISRGMKSRRGVTA